MIVLPDVNVLIAFAWPSHVHHRNAREWFAGASPLGWATCPFTQCGFVRVSSNPRIVESAVTPRDALTALRRLTSAGRHEFWPDDLDLVSEADGTLRLLMGHRQVTDAYLLGLALRHGGRLATFDQGICDLLPKGSPHAERIEVIGLHTPPPH